MKRKLTWFIVFILFLLTGKMNAAPVIYEKQYLGFTVWLDCIEHGALVFRYDISRDNGNVKRRGSFRKDSSVPVECQQKSGRSYRTSFVDPKSGTWDRGHLVPANHLDNDVVMMKESFFITNMLPQNSTFNQAKGAWYQTEIITECYRDITLLSIWGGVIWGDDVKNDYFVLTHGIKTPDYWWKLIYRHDKKEYVAWLFPNHSSSLGVNIDDYLISVVDLKALLTFIPDFGKLEDMDIAGVTPVSSWLVRRSGVNLVCEGIIVGKG